jgi:hypothetical protein
MSTEILTGPLGELRAASTAGGGTALTSTATRIVLPIGTKWLSLTPRNLSGAAVVKFNVNPWLTVLKTTDLLVANLTDYSDAAQDSSTATDVVLSSLATLANGGSLYVGAEVPFAGAEIDVDATNGTSATLAVTYWDGTTWTNITPTDGTASGGAPFAQDGNVTWTVPTAWVKAALNDAVVGEMQNVGILTHPLFWTRWVVSAANDASTTLNSLIAINRSTAYAELAAGQPFEEAVTVGPGGICSVTALTDAGTASLIVNVATRGGGRFM